MSALPLSVANLLALLSLSFVVVALLPARFATILLQLMSIQGQMLITLWTHLRRLDTAL